MNKGLKIGLIILVIVVALVGVVELIKYRGRQAALEKFKSSYKSATTSKQQANLRDQLYKDYAKSTSMFSFSQSQAHDNAVCDSLDGSIADAATRCATGENFGACDAIRTLVQTHEALDCGKDHVKESE